MLEWVGRSESHVLVAGALVALALLVAIGILDNTVAADSKARQYLRLDKLGETLRYGVKRTLLGFVRFLVFVLTEGWFYGALADLMAIAAGVAPVVYFIGSSAPAVVAGASEAASAAQAGAASLGTALAPTLTVGQTVQVVGGCAVAVVIFRGVAAALGRRRKSA